MVLVSFKVFQIAVRFGGGDGGGCNFRISNLSKLKVKAAFCEYWASLKIEISMICGPKEHEIKQKWYVIDFGGEEIKIWLGESTGGRGGLFQVRGTSEFFAGGGGTAPWLHGCTICMLNMVGYARFVKNICIMQVL